MPRKKRRRMEPPGKATIKAKADAAAARSAGKPEPAPFAPLTPPPIPEPVKTPEPVDPIKAEVGRPTKYTRQIANNILLRIALGETLNQVCRTEGYPSRPTVMRWVIEDRDGLSDRFARAREAQHAHWADEIVEIADDGRNDWQEREGRDGSTYVALNREAVSRSNLRVDTRKWLLVKLRPETYGEKIETTHNGTEAFVELLRGMKKKPA